MLVPVLGAGSRRWLTGNIGEDDPLVSWKQLVRGVASGAGVTIEVAHDTMTAAFEDVVHAVHVRSPETQRVSRTEARLIAEHVVRPLQASALAARTCAGVRARTGRIHAANFADRIDL